MFTPFLPRHKVLIPHFEQFPESTATIIQSVKWLQTDGIRRLYTVWIYVDVL